MNSSLVSTACRRAPTCVLLLNRVVIHRTAATAAASVKSESIVNEHEKTKQQRVSSTKVDRKAKTSNSFVLNLFRGQFYPNEVFPYPNVLNEEQKDNVKMLIDPIWKFFEEKNDAAKNDQLEKVRKENFVFF